MKIIDIKQRRKHVCGILFDDEISLNELGAETDAAGWLALDSELCEINNLKIGTELSETQLIDYIHKSHIKRAKSRAMWYLSRSTMCKKALFNKLKKAFPDYAATAAVERMTELRVIDDNDYAVRKLQKIVDDKKVSIRFAKQLLISEGVDSDIADFAAEQIEYNPQNTLLMLIEKKYKNQITDPVGIKKTIAALMRKGYCFGEIKDALMYFDKQTEYTEEF